MISKMLKMQMLEDEDDLVYVEIEKKMRIDFMFDGCFVWMWILYIIVFNWLYFIFQMLSYFKCIVENIKDFLFRFFEREVKMGVKLFQDVCQDFVDVVQVCEGKKKQINYLCMLINELVKGILFWSWFYYMVFVGMIVIQWVFDFSERIKQLQNILLVVVFGGVKELKNIYVCLGGLFVFEVYIIVIRQYVVQVNSWFLEEFCLEVNVIILQGVIFDVCSFGVMGLKF